MTESLVLTLVIAGALAIVLIIIRLRQVSMSTLVFGLIGAIIGLLMGALASVPLSKLPEPIGGTSPLVITIVFTLVAMVIVLSRRASLLNLLPFLSVDSGDKSGSGAGRPRVLVDTSVIIDGRIADIAEAGFVPGQLVVPRFVLAELQNIADSDDAMRRGRGRRGLEVLNRLRELDDVEVEVTDEDAVGVREVDAKLVVLAQRFKCHILTTDYNLNRVAAVQGVRVLNVNELSNAIRPVVLPGEQMMVRVVQPGKERNQGVGYLADGTMIVVENGDKLIGQDVATEVTRVFQTVAGKMIFATPKPAAEQPRRDEPEVKPATAPPAESGEPAAEVVGETPAAAEANAAKPHRHRGRRGGRGRNAGGSVEDRLVEQNKPDNS